jgi:hypothetical protein
MTSLTKVREITVQSYDELNEILVDIQIDEDSNIVHVSKPTITSTGMTFQILYHIKNMERELEKKDEFDIE